MIGTVIDVNIEITCDDKFVRCGNSRSQEGIKLIEKNGVVGS